MAALDAVSQTCLKAVHNYYTCLSFFLTHKNSCNLKVVQRNNKQFTRLLMTFLFWALRLLITSSQPLTLLLAAAVYDLPTGTVSLCLAVDSASTAVVLSTMPARQSGTRCPMNLLRNSDSFDSYKRSMKTILFSRYSCVQRIRGYFYNEMRYINLRFTYLLTYSAL